MMKLKALSLILFICLMSQSVSAQFEVDTLIHLPGSVVYGSLSSSPTGSFRVLKPENNPMILDGSVSEAFKQVPSLVTDIEGGIIYRGSNQSAMLLNGVPYGLLEEYNGDFLIQLPARFFSQISVLSTPPVEWITDGDAGIINLSSYLSGSDSPLSINLGAGWNERYNAGAILNHQTGRWQLAAKYNYRKEFRQRTFRKTTTDLTGTTEMNNNAEARPDIHLTDLQIGYDLSASDKISLYGLYYHMDYDRYGRINNRKLNPSGEIINHIYRHRHNAQKQKAAAIEGRWLHKFYQPKDFLELIFNYNNFGYEEENRYQNEQVETANIIKEDDLFINHTKHNYYVSAVYNKSFAGKWFWKSGYSARFKDEQYKAIGHDKTNNEWVKNQANSNDYNFNRRTHLLFTSFVKQGENWRVEPGVQFEYQHQKIQGEAKEQFRLYPRVDVKYIPRNNHILSFQYLQRSYRPVGSWLNRFKDKSDATHITRGNPSLKDELIHSLELSYKYQGGDYYIIPALYFRNRSNRIMEIASQEDEQTIWVKENMGNSRTMGLELSAYWKPLFFLSWHLGGNVYKDEIDGRIVGYSEKKSLVCGDLRSSLQFFITSDLDLQVDGFYISDQLTPQGKIKKHHTVNVALSYYFIHRKLRANLSIQNIFDSLEEVTLINTENLQVRQERNRDPRMTWLSLAYSW